MTSLRFAAAVLLAAPGLTASATVLTSDAAPETAAAFDILAAEVTREGNVLTFRMTTRGEPGADRPVAAGAPGGAPVWPYVWPTTLDPAPVGFEGGTGILALAATSHPDFDDTPLSDENADGDPGNDGGEWHSNWVVLAPTEACGQGALAVRDIAEGEAPALPPTWPGLPLYIDSPGFSPVFGGPGIVVRVALPRSVEATGERYDGVTAALRVNADVHAPLLCVTDVWDVASGDLSLPGRID